VTNTRTQTTPLSYHQHLHLIAAAQVQFPRGAARSLLIVDFVWARIPQSLCRSNYRMHRAIAALALCVSAQAQSTLQLNISVNDTVLNTVAPEYVSANFDWHLDTEEAPAWVNASIMRWGSNGFINLEDTRLRTLTSALAPMHLRVGGSEGDLVVYNVAGTECQTEAAQFCLTMDRWDELYSFARDTGVTIAFGLNAMAGRANSSSRMNFTNLGAFCNVLPILVFYASALAALLYKCRSTTLRPKDTT